LAKNQQFLSKLAKLEQIALLSENEQAPPAAIAMVGKMELLVPLQGLIDIDAELARLAREADKLDKELARIDTKLNNPKFVEKAPAEVVAKEREKRCDTQHTLNKLAAQVSQLQQLTD